MNSGCHSGTLESPLLQTVGASLKTKEEMKRKLGVNQTSRSGNAGNCDTKRSQFQVQTAGTLTPLPLRDTACWGLSKEKCISHGQFWGLVPSNSKPSSTEGEYQLISYLSLLSYDLFSKSLSTDAAQ